jgi:hypothetical protein
MHGGFEAQYSGCDEPARQRGQRSARRVPHCEQVVDELADDGMAANDLRGDVLSLPHRCYRVIDMP